LSARAIEISRAADSEHGASLTHLGVYATALTAVGRHDLAKTVLDESIVKARQAGSAERLMRNLAVAIRSSAESGDLRRADELLREAQSIKSPNASSTGNLQIAQAQLADAEGHLNEAVALATTGVATLSGAATTAATFSLMQARIVLAELLNKAGRFTDALVPAAQAATAARERQSKQAPSWHLGQALLEEAVARRGLGEVPSARALAADALVQLQQTVGPAARATRRAQALVAELATS
jgi:tetratricopeptide (TPR) repeat protein